MEGSGPAGPPRARSTTGSSAGPDVNWVSEPEIKLLELRREAVALLADLLLDAARRRARVSGGASAGVIDGASGSVVPFPGEAGKARCCA